MNNHKQNPRSVLRRKKEESMLVNYLSWKITFFRYFASNWPLCIRPNAIKKKTTNQHVIWANNEDVVYSWKVFKESVLNLCLWHQFLVVLCRTAVIQFKWNGTCCFLILMLDTYLKPTTYFSSSLCWLHLMCALSRECLTFTASNQS